MDEHMDTELKPLEEEAANGQVYNKENIKSDVRLCFCFSYPSLAALP